MTSNIIKIIHIVQSVEFSTIVLLTVLSRILRIDDITPIVKQMIENTANAITINITPHLSGFDFFNDSSLSLDVYSSIMGDYLTYLERNNISKRDSDA